MCSLSHSLTLPPSVCVSWSACSRVRVWVRERERTQGKTSACTQAALCRGQKRLSRTLTLPLLLPLCLSFPHPLSRSLTLQFATDTWFWAVFAFFISPSLVPLTHPHPPPSLILIPILFLFQIFLFIRHTLSACTLSTLHTPSLMIARKGGRAGTRERMSEWEDAI